MHSVEELRYLVETSGKAGMVTLQDLLERIVDQIPEADEDVTHPSRRCPTARSA